MRRLLRVAASDPMLSIGQAGGLVQATESVPHAADLHNAPEVPALPLWSVRSNSLAQ